MKRLMFMFLVLVTIFYGIDYQTRAWVYQLLRSGDTDSVRIIYFKGDSIFCTLARFDSINVNDGVIDTLTTAEYADIDSGDVDNLVVNSSAYFSCDIDLNELNLDDADTVFANFLAPDDSSQWVLDSNVLHKGNMLGELGAEYSARYDTLISASTDDAQPTHRVISYYDETNDYGVIKTGDASQLVLGADGLTTIDSASVTNYVNADSVEADHGYFQVHTTTDSIDTQHAVIDIGLLIGGGVTVGKWFTRGDSLFLTVGTDSFPIPKKP